MRLLSANDIRSVFSARNAVDAAVLDGACGQGAVRLEAMLCVWKLEQVRVFDLNPERARQFAAAMQEKLAGYGAEIRAVERNVGTLWDPA